MKAKWTLMLLIAALVLVQAALAKGPPQKITISGGDLAGEIEITGDESILTALSMTLQEYTTLSSEAPEGISGEGYLITRFYEVSSGRYVAFDEVRYHPNPEGGLGGSINYIGMVNGSSEYDGKWFRANPNGESILIELLNGAEKVEAGTNSAGILDVLLTALTAFVGVQ